jgi:hypothetical protein
VGRLVVPAGGTSWASDVPPRRPTFLPGVGPSSQASDLPPGRQRFLPVAGSSSRGCEVGPASACRMFVPIGATLLSQCAPATFFFRTRRTKVSRTTPRKQRRRGRATPDGLVGCPRSWPRAGGGETSWRRKHPGCRTRSRPPSDHRGAPATGLRRALQPRRRRVGRDEGRYDALPFAVGDDGDGHGAHEPGDAARS